MKPEKIIFDETDKMQVVVQVPAKTQKIIHQIKPHKGHKLFEINPVTGKYKEAEYESVNATIGGGVHKKLIANDNCIYISSLNKKNALKKFLQIISKRLGDKT